MLFSQIFSLHSVVPDGSGIRNVPTAVHYEPNESQGGQRGLVLDSNAQCVQFCVRFPLVLRFRSIDVSTGVLYAVHPHASSGKATGSMAAGLPLRFFVS